MDSKRLNGTGPVAIIREDDGHGYSYNGNAYFHSDQCKKCKDAAEKSGTFTLNGHQYVEGKHNTDLCELCIEIGRAQADLSHSMNCDFCQAEAELPVGDDPKTEN